MPKPVEVGKHGKRSIRLTPEDRSTHTHIIGASGRGKSKALEHIIRQDILKGHGVCLIDPHGTLYDDLVKWCARKDMFRHRTIHLINPGNEDSTVGFNPLWVREGEDISRRVDRVVDALTKVWGGSDMTSTPRLSKVLTCVFYALAFRNLTIVEAPDLLSTSNKDGLREFLSSRLDSSLFDRLWADFNALPDKTLHEYFESTDSRFIRFLASPTIRAMLGSHENPIDFRKCMDEGEIVLINLKESGRLSLANATVIGSLISNELFSLASERPEAVAKRHPYYFYIDECYRFLSSDIEDMLNQTRKRGLHVTLVHHYLYQLEKAGDEIYHAVMTNAQTKLIFGGASDADAEVLAREVFRTEFDLEQVEEVLSKPTPTGTFHREWLSSESDTVGEAHGSATGGQEAAAAGTGISQTYNESGAVGGYVEVINSADLSGESWSEFDVYSRSHSDGRHEVLVPDYAIMPTALKSLEKVLHEAMVLIRALGPQFAIMKVPDKRSVYVKIPFVKDAIVTDRTVNAFIKEVIKRSDYTLSRDDALTIIEDRRRKLVEIAAGDIIVDHNTADGEEDEDPFLQ